MKKNTLKIGIFFLLLVCTINLSAQNDNGLKVLNPKQGGWSKTNGKFESVKMTITPSGAYTNIDMIFEISAQNTTLYWSLDSLEAEYKFSLPQGSILHEASLWMNGIEVPAKIYERNKAKLIYEGLVNRRIDPIIVYQNEHNTYEARIFPILNPDSRKFRISYLVPNNFTTDYIEVPLDLGMLRSDLTSQYPEVEISLNTNTIFGTPIKSITGGTKSQNGNYEVTTLLALQQNIQLNSSIVFKNTPLLSNQLITQPTIGTEGFYQLFVQPPSINAISKNVFILDYRQYNSIYDYATILNTLKNKMLIQLKDSDQFNIIYFNNGNAISMSNQWLFADSATIVNTFSNLPVTLNNSTSTSKKLLLKAIDYLDNNNEEGTIFLLSNERSNQGLNMTNQDIDEIIDSMNKIYPIHIFDYNSSEQYSFWANNQYYYNNEYFFENLCLLTNGNYNKLTVVATNFNWNTNYSTKSFVGSFSSSFNNVVPHFDYLNISKSYNGVQHSDYLIPNSTSLPIGNTYIEVGKYIGSGSVNFSFDCGYNATNYNSSGILIPVVSIDTFNSKMWAYQHIKRLVSLNSSNNLIVQTSENYSVLCEQTAFLALEADTVRTVTTLPVTTNSIDKLILEASLTPNPYSNQQNIQIKLVSEDQFKDWEISIYNVLGQPIKSLTGNTTSKNYLDICWTENTNLSQGIYLIKIKIGNKSELIKSQKL